MKLNLGSGRVPKKDFVNIDIRDGQGIDIRSDLDVPDSLAMIRTASVDEVHALGILEHLPHWENLLLEIARVLRPHGHVLVRVPYGMDYVAYHVRHFDRNTFNPFRSDYVHIDDDLIARKKTWGSLEFREPYFILERRWIQHFVPFAYHAKKYFGIDVTKLPVGKRLNLMFELRRNETTWRR